VKSILLARFRAAILPGEAGVSLRTTGTNADLANGQMHPTDIADSALDTERNIRLDPKIRRASLILALMLPAAVITMVPEVNSVAQVATALVGSIGAAMIIWRRGLDDDLSVVIFALLADAIGIAAGLTTPGGMMFAILVPVVGVAAMSATRRDRLWAALAACGGLSTAVGVALAFTVGPRASVLELANPLGTYTLIIVFSAIGLLMLWRSSRMQARAVEVAVAAAAVSAESAAELAREAVERQRLQAELLQAQKMETLGQLSGAIAHDFNNLLQAISGYTELAGDSAPPNSDLADNLEQIRRAAGRATDLTRQLLAFSQPSTAGATVVNVNACIAEAIPLIRRLVGPSIEVTTATDPSAGHVYIGPGQLEQVIMNLSLNARDAMPHGGTLTIETAPATNDQVRIFVRDTGGGIPENIRDRIFDPFFTTKENGKGTGLGLAIVESIICSAGGSITVDSDARQGTTFCLSLPAVEPIAPTVAPTVGPAERGSETVLLLEDEEAIRRLSQRILTQQGYVVLCAANADEARKLWEEHGEAVDLLLSDVTMPGISGPTFAAELVRLAPGLRTLFISGHLPNDPKVLFGDARVRFLQKPFTMEALLQGVREALDVSADR
jgi:signal transduction histidine kinase